MHFLLSADSSKLRYYSSYVYGSTPIASPGDTPAVDASKRKEIEVAEVRFREVNYRKGLVNAATLAEK
jgi:hypothetical protein